MSQAQPLWPYVTPGIQDDLFERLPGIPMSPREVRVLILSQLCLMPTSVLWDVGAGTGTIAVEAALRCPQGRVVAVERDGEVAGLIGRNGARFGASNIAVVEGNAPECLAEIQPLPDRICVESGRPIQAVLEQSWAYLQPGGRLVATTASLDGLYSVGGTLASLRALRVEVVQVAVNRLENRGQQQVFRAIDPIFVFSAEKVA